MDTNTIEYKGYKIEIETDTYPSNPRTEWDNLGTMVCFHNRYDLGDKKHEINHEDFNGWKEMAEYIVKQKNAVVVLPIYMYDHSGITINTTGFSCPWDSGQIGYIFITAEKAREEYSKKRISKQLKKRLAEYLKNEVETYDNYLTGSVYQYKVLDKEDNEIDSCSGYYGYDNEKSGLMDAARTTIDNDIKSKEEVIA